jgi:hypothetical protein
VIDKLVIYLCVIGGFAGIAIFGIQEAWGALFAVVAIALITIIAYAFIGPKQIKKLKEIMGQSITEPVLKEVFEVIEYNPSSRIPTKLVHSAQLIDDWTEISGSDYFKGKYKGMNILFSDLHLQRKEIETDSDGKKTTNYITVFKGQWLVCDFNKPLAASLRILERKGRSGGTYRVDSSKSSIETENIEFNKKFRILTSDGHTAFYILTPHFMERLVAVDNRADAQSFFCFQDGHVHIALNTGHDSFELKGVKADNVENVRQKFRNDMKDITDIIDLLLLNDRLFQEEV